MNILIGKGCLSVLLRIILWAITRIAWLFLLQSVSLLKKGDGLFKIVSQDLSQFSDNAPELLCMSFATLSYLGSTLLRFK